MEERLDDEDAFLRRVSSFQVEKWFAKPDSLSPLFCASRGWTNSDRDRLVCLSCHATLTYPSSGSLLESEEDTETFIRSLEWEHDADCIWCEDHCPDEFLTFKFKTPNKLHDELFVRFHRLCTLWDLPKVEVPDFGHEFDQIKETLINSFSRTTEVCMEEEGWKHRVDVLVLLALFGWDLFILDYKIGADIHEAISSLDSKMEITLSEHQCRPEDNSHCSARQSYLHCRLCNAVVGLWTIQSESFISLEKFQPVLRQLCEKLNFSLVDEETGEVQDLFHRMQQHPVEEIEPITTGRSPTLETISIPQQTQPVFGIGRLKKCRLERSGSGFPRDQEFLETNVQSSVVFSPVESHRHFCPYRKQWKTLSHAVWEVEKFLFSCFITACHSRLSVKCGVRTCPSRPSFPLPYASALRPPRRQPDGPSAGSLFSKKLGHVGLNRKSFGASTPYSEPRKVVRRRSTQGHEVSSVVDGLTTKKAQEAVLYRMFKGHSGAVTSAMVILDDECHQELVTASLDNTVAYWHLEQIELHKSKMESSRVNSQCPVLCMTGDSDRAKDGCVAVYCGRAKENDILCWDHLPNAGFNSHVVLHGHSGWIRDLKSTGRWMFSVDCNNLRQWDLSWAIPRHVQDISLYKGDILCIACSDDQIFVGVNDGTIHSWNLTKAGDLIYSSCCAAHGGRVTSLVWHQGVLYSGGNDGSIRSWTATSLEPITAFNDAHDGKKINCLAVGPDGILYSGGEDDGLIKRWNGKFLFPCQQPLFCHKAPVRVLNFGAMNSLISGDADGMVSLWRV